MPGCGCCRAGLLALSGPEWGDRMGADHSLIRELEDAIHGGSKDKRIDTLRRVTDLFLQDSDRLTDQQIAVFDDVLGHLIKRIETKARAELSRRLAPVDNAPIEVMRNLAHDDDIGVAGPVLERSKRLAISDLVEIAKTKSQAHLHAISGRAQLEAPVTDVLLSIAAIKPSVTGSPATPALAFPKPNSTSSSSIPRPIAVLQGRSVSGWIFRCSFSADCCRKRPKLCAPSYCPRLIRNIRPKLDASWQQFQMRSPKRRAPPLIMRARNVSYRSCKRRANWTKLLFWSSRERTDTRK